jgi:hypothetical protein
MNKHDTDNLQFMLALSETQFDIWYAQLDNDDADYAMELLQMARTEISMNLAAMHDEPNSLVDAQNVLGKFTLKGKV